MTGHDRIQDRRQDKGTGPKERTVQSIERSTGLDREKIEYRAETSTEDRADDRTEGRKID